LRSDLEALDVRHLALGRRSDDVGVRLELINPQQPIVIGRLVLRPNS
jgi:hypothetical protein